MGSSIDQKPQAVSQGDFASPKPSLELSEKHYPQSSKDARDLYEGRGSDEVTETDASEPTSDSALDKQQWRYKIIALGATLMLSAGSHFVSNSLNSLKSTLKVELAITNTQYGVLSGTISLVNTILPFFCGVIMDMFGPGWGAFGSCFAIVLGNFITIIGTYTGKFALLVVGRVIFGFGSSTIVTTQETMLSHWFRGKGLALSIGVQIMVSKLFGWLASATVVEVAERTGFYGNAFWVGEGIALFSLLMVAVYALMMWKLNRLEQKQREVAEKGGLVYTAAPVMYGGHGQEQDQQQEHEKADHSPSANNGLTVMSESGAGGSSKPSPGKGRGGSSSKKKISWRQLYYMVYFPNIYWLLPLNEFIMGAVWTPFLGIAAEYVKKRWHETNAMAAWKSSISLAIPIVVSPLMGLCIDRYGLRGHMVISSALLLLLSMILLGWTHVSPEAGLTLFSLSLTLGPVALTSAVALYLPMNMVGTGIGLIKCGLNFGIIIVDVLIGRLQDFDNDAYDRVMVMMLVLACISVLTSLAFTFGDYYLEGGLQSVGYYRRNELMEKRKPIEQAMAKAAAEGAPIPKYKYIYVAIFIGFFIVSWIIYGVYLLVK
ncbi:hypothetical protein H4R33_005930 [Dimargaris cristalligena]|nr:hypothetical protein H4R33_005930 [Dimargaris cristalligena]